LAVGYWLLAVGRWILDYETRNIPILRSCGIIRTKTASMLYTLKQTFHREKNFALFANPLRSLRLKTSAHFCEVSAVSAGNQS
jgi:hypothetical protein